MAYPAWKSLLFAQRKMIHGGAGMKVLWGLGKCAGLVFWLVAVINLLQPFTDPIHLAVNLVASVLLLVHLLEVLVFNRTLKTRAHPWVDRLQVLLFGIFHIKSMEARHA